MRSASRVPAARRRPQAVCRLAPVLAAAILAVTATAGPAAAHPHGWIDVRVELQFDAAGALVSLRESWLFDELYTAYATEGMDGDGDGRPDPAQLTALLEINLANLAEYDFFTRATLDGREVAFAPPQAAVSAMRGERLEMRFLLPLAEPVEIGSAAFAYRVYDPTYYVEMLHAEQEDAVRLLAAPPGCLWRLEPANPSLETVSLAAALDRNESAGDGLGALFAETVTVTCATDEAESE